MLVEIKKINIEMRITSGIFSYAIITPRAFYCTSVSFRILIFSYSSNRIINSKIFIQHIHGIIMKFPFKIAFFLTVKTRNNVEGDCCWTFLGDPVSTFSGKITPLPDNFASLFNNGFHFLEIFFPTCPEPHNTIK